MTETIQVALIAGAAPTLLAAAAFVQSLRNGNKIQDVHLSLNSRLSELVIAAKAQGRQDERDAHSVTVEGVPKEPDGDS
jgi:hypothetical protein